MDNYLKSAKNGSSVESWLGLMVGWKSSAVSLTFGRKLSEMELLEELLREGSDASLFCLALIISAGSFLVGVS